MPSLSQPHEKARPGRARLGTVSAREAGVAMFANKTRILLTFREDVLGRARVFPGLKLVETSGIHRQIRNRLGPPITNPVDGMLHEFFEPGLHELDGRPQCPCDPSTVCSGSPQ